MAKSKIIPLQTLNATHQDAMDPLLAPEDRTRDQSDSSTKKFGRDRDGSLAEILEVGRRPKRCVVIAIDGARRDYLERFEAPRMQMLAEQGVGFRNAIASNGVAETANGFATIGTGLITREHGVVTSREWYDHEKNELVYVYDWDKNKLHIDVPWISDRVKEQRANFRIASISAKDRLAVLLAGPSADLVAFSYREHVFHRHVKGSYTGRGVTATAFKYTERVGYTLPPFLEGLEVPRRADWHGPGFNHASQETGDTALIDRFIMDGALAILEHFDPDLLFIGLVAPNIVGHKYGPESPEMAETFRITDEQIGRLLDLAERRGTRESTLFIIVSDHGMTLKPRGIDPTIELRERFRIQVSEDIVYTFAGSAGGLYLRHTVPAAIERMVEAVRQIPHVRGAWWKYDPQAPWFIRRMAHPHTPDILIIPERDWVILDPGVKQPNVVAHHGPPYPSDVNIVQVYSGPGIKRLGLIGKPLDLQSDELLNEEEIQELPEQRDIAPLILYLFGLQQEATPLLVPRD